MTRLSFVEVARVTSPPFDYDDDTGWQTLFEQVHDAIRYNNPWMMIGRRPDCDVFVVDVVGPWRSTLRRLNIRNVVLYELDQRIR